MASNTLAGRLILIAEDVAVIACFASIPCEPILNAAAKNVEPTDRAEMEAGVIARTAQLMRLGRRMLEAIQHAMEQIPSAQRSRSVLEVGEKRYEGAGIQKLYASTAYPLDRSEKFIP